MYKKQKEILRKKTKNPISLFSSDDEDDIDRENLERRMSENQKMNVSFNPSPIKLNSESAQLNLENVKVKKIENRSYSTNKTSNVARPSALSNSREKDPYVQKIQKTVNIKDILKKQNISRQNQLIKNKKKLQKKSKLKSKSCLSFQNSKNGQIASRSTKNISEKNDKSIKLSEKNISIRPNSVITKKSLNSKLPTNKNQKPIKKNQKLNISTEKIKKNAKFIDNQNEISKCANIQNFTDRINSRNKYENTKESYIKDNVFNQTGIRDKRKLSKTSLSQDNFNLKLKNFDTSDKKQKIGKPVNIRTDLSIHTNDKMSKNYFNFNYCSKINPNSESLSNFINKINLNSVRYECVRKRNIENQTSKNNSLSKNSKNIFNIDGYLNKKKSSIKNKCLNDAPSSKLKLKNFNSP